MRCSSAGCTGGYEVTIQHLKVIEGNQESLSNQMLDDIRAVLMDTKYDGMNLSTILGVLEMLKLEQWERN